MVNADIFSDSEHAAESACVDGCAFVYDQLYLLWHSRSVPYQGAGARHASVRCGINRGPGSMGIFDGFNTGHIRQRTESVGRLPALIVFITSSGQLHTPGRLIAFGIHAV